MLKPLFQIAGIVFLALLVRYFIMAPFCIPTASMHPTLIPGDCVLADRLAFKLPDKEGPRRNDVVIFQRPENPKKVYTKRVVAIGGDTIEIKEKRVFINQVEIHHASAWYSDPYTLPPGEENNRDNVKAHTVPKGKVFILGDNRDNSLDSRVWGGLDADTLKAKVLMVYWSKDPKTGQYRWRRIGRWID
ncbi:MAG: signal peptidase I [Deltaproteobacteria bacterium]|uniref:signal peptidase I n=1 Tax=Desulfobacula sp. TaxID=2593537 RepID=UPI0019AE69C7|nr:signal peptidase I [Candidatus Desulfobacula maris]MBL6995578.1 signal peptidase I [Desulfobacula sp.]